jgi:hypothetical protein
MSFAEVPVCIDTWSTVLGESIMTVIYTFDVFSSLDGPIFGGGADFDLELIESRVLDGHTQELIYRPTLHA